MAGIARKSDPALWEKVKAAVTESAEGGKPGQWSARKAQLATAEYKKQGGGYLGRKQADNHLAEWTREDWGTQSGAKSLESGERYLPRAAREALTPAEYRRSSARKRQDLAAGRQVSAQPKDVAQKTAAARHHGATGKGKDKDMGDEDPGGKDPHDDIAAEFRRLVNIPAADLRPWLDTWESQAVGFTREGEDEAVGHRSGRRILELLEGGGEDAEADTEFRREVVGYIHRHLAQRPDGDVTDTRWRHSLMNWGHDPMRDTSEGTTMNTDETSQTSASMPDAAPESEAATPAARKPRARRAKAEAKVEDGNGAAPARKPRAARSGTAKPRAAKSGNTKSGNAKSGAEAKPARSSRSAQAEGGRKGGATRSPAKATAARSNGAKGGTATTRRSAAAAPKRAASTTAAKRATGATTKRTTGATAKRAAAPAKRATATTAKRATAPAKRAAAPAKRTAAATTKRAAATPAKRGTGAAAKRQAATTAKRAAPAKRATAATPKRASAAAPKRATATKRTAAAAPNRGTAAAPKLTAAKAAAPKRAPAKAKPAARGAAGRTSAAAKGGRSSTPRKRG